MNNNQETNYNTQLNHPNESSVPITPRKNNKIPIVIIGVLFIVIALGVMFYLQNDNNYNDYPNSEINGQEEDSVPNLSAVKVDFSSCIATMVESVCQETITIGERQIVVSYFWQGQSAQSFIDVNQAGIFINPARGMHVGSTIYFFETIIVFVASAGEPRSATLYVYDYEGNRLHEIWNLDLRTAGMVVSDNLNERVYWVEDNNIIVVGSRFDRLGSSGSRSGLHYGNSRIDVCSIEDLETVYGATYKIEYLGNGQISSITRKENTERRLRDIMPTINCDI